MNQCWCWTYNNYGDDGPTWSDTSMGYLLWVPQVGELGTPHLQGYVQFKKPVRMATAKKLLDCERSVHLEPQRGSVVQAVAYIKDDAKKTNDGDVVEYGVLDPALEPRKMAASELMAAVAEEIKSGEVKTERDIVEKHPMMYARKGVRETLMKLIAYKRADERKYVDVPVEMDDPLMKMMIAYLKTPLKYRNFLWIWDAKGASGKTTRLQWIMSLVGEKAQYLKPVKMTDMCHMVNEDANLFLIDIPRSSKPPYGFIECIRDGRVLSGKYEGSSKRLRKDRRMIICANTAPDWTRLTKGGTVVCLDKDEDQEPQWVYAPGELKWVNT